MEFGIIGLGKMGSNLSIQAIEKGFRVVGTDKKPKPELEQIGVELAPDIPGLIKLLHHPRIIFLYIPAGPTVDDIIEGLLEQLEAGDIIIDGGNSHYGDSIRRHRHSQEVGVHFVDCGTSGGLGGARYGACFMVGGEPEPVKLAEPILKALAVPEGYIHTGPPGSGHFVKLIHNAIEFGMLQAIGEGTSLLKEGPYDLDLTAIFHNWSHGSVIRGWLVELMEQQLKERDIEEVPSYVEDTGEVNWIIEEALRLEVPIPVTAVSVMELFSSRNKKHYAHRAIAMMRHAFGGHPFGPDEAIRKEREVGEVSPVRPAA
ncbi:MAG TPA: decarboxylating 6-phosphogluconate dehydrogenase [Anaerolineae bacterium]|nr:decarboxylating 6-phosphogluconate dehydrogenase [Anaerolineae bacterium]